MTIVLYILLGLFTCTIGAYVVCAFVIALGWATYHAIRPFFDPFQLRRIDWSDYFVVGLVSVLIIPTFLFTAYCVGASLHAYFVS
jgi:multisubunit Na+/H+ antiporter MnhB subunit